jgi:hypothetical protein
LSNRKRKLQPVLLFVESFTLLQKIPSRFGGQAMPREDKDHTLQVSVILKAITFPAM